MKKTTKCSETKCACNESGSCGGKCGCKCCKPSMRKSEMITHLIKTADYLDSCQWFEDSDGVNALVTRLAQDNSDWGEGFPPDNSAMQKSEHEGNPFGTDVYDDPDYAADSAQEDQHSSLPESNTIFYVCKWDDGYIGISEDDYHWWINKGNDPLEIIYTIEPDEEAMYPDPD